MDILTIMTATGLLLGYCRYAGYYGGFGIDIYIYLSTAEILLSFLPLIIMLAFSAMISMSFKAKFLTSPLSLDNEKNERINKVLYTIVVLLVLFEYLLIKNFVTVSIQGLLSAWQVLAWSVSAVGLLCFFLVRSRTSQALVFTIFVAGCEIFMYSRLEAYRIKFGIDSTSVSFVYDQKVIQTSDSLRYVGQTEKVLFLFNAKDSSSVTYRFEHVDSLVKRSHEHIFFPEF
jgi:hypothetical protein